jgi:hypothetical protein
LIPPPAFIKEKYAPIAFATDNAFVLGLKLAGVQGLHLQSNVISIAL